MNVEVLLFARARELAGAPSIIVELGPHATVGDLRAALARRIPAMAPLAARAALAVNQEFASDETLLAPGQEIALLPPVSGGAA